MKNQDTKMENSTNWISALLKIKEKLQKVQTQDTSLECKMPRSLYPQKPWRPGEECVTYA